MGSQSRSVGKKVAHSPSEPAFAGQVPSHSPPVSGCRKKRNRFLGTLAAVRFFRGCLNVDGSRALTDKTIAICFPQMSRSVLCLLMGAAVVGQTSGDIDGFHVDDESCSGLLQNNKTEQIAVCVRARI
jgi:hypothetical protein